MPPATQLVTRSQTRCDQAIPSGIPADLPLCFLLLLLGACAPAATTIAPDKNPQAAPYPSTYAVNSSVPVVIRNATVLDGRDHELRETDVLLVDGKIAAIGADLSAPSAALEVEAGGKWVTPGIIDIHSHLGVYPSPAHESNQDGNELTDPNTAQVWAEHSVWPQDPQFLLALAGGVTTLQVLPGSGNLFGGRGVILRNRPGRTVQEMKFPGARHSLKMACGENPKRIYGITKQATPASSMANVAGYRAAWVKAAEYIRKWDAYEKKKTAGDDADPPERDLQMDTLAGVLRGEIHVQIHCYRADEMATMLDIAQEFGYRIAAFHHAVEAYKIADLLARHDVCAAMWPDWWGFKAEANDMVLENIALVDRAGACAVVHSDSAITTQHLNQEAAKALAAGNRMGMNISRAHAMGWITYNAARAMQLSERIGSIEPGKIADLVIWDGDPFSIYTRVEKVFMDGVRVFDRLDATRRPLTDIELGTREGLGSPP